MPFHFKKAESPARAMRRVCRERIGVARECLRQGDRPGAVHGVRKEIKKLRAALRLVRGEIGQNDYRRSVKALRRAADGLAAPRDARVMLKVYAKLTRRAPRRFSGVEAVLREHCRRETRRFRRDDAGALAERRLRKLNRRIGGWKIKSSGWVALEPGLRESYRRGRSALDLVRRDPSPEKLHAWRKRVKELGHHLRLLCPAWPAATRALTEALERLAEALGDEHDLSLLQQFIAERCRDEVREVRALTRLIQARQQKLRAAALKLGARLYAATPAVFCRSRGREWNAWRGERRRL